VIIDLPLVVVSAGVALALSVLHLAFRPELRNGRELGRLYSYAMGLGCYAAGVLMLALWRGIEGPQAIIDVGGLLVASAVPPVAFRKLFPMDKPQRNEDAQTAIADIQRRAKELTNE
jgi:hypothetical protein